ncbi:hypothetical protein E7Y32_02390 [Arthrobacter sp. UKPF54-2]|uniref:hypothetical protein n=1 Tax=Arthrobacter sp. UKPF54-2 TaxID=2600159 RepID=UPI0011B1709D|nr:hypothetical protein [Arthrobacter sp. UKPF54-2]QDY89191.1 hypothetical protein E7Y32_02390 [Arthrobacter sp. UKPF54-2]
MPNRYRLKGATLEEIRSKAEAQYGPAARIVSAERVISPGIAGLFAANRYEAIIEVQPKHDVVTGEVVPDADILAEGEIVDAPRDAVRDTQRDTPRDAPRDTPRPGVPGGLRSASAPGHELQGDAIAALLAEADAAELTLHRTAGPGVSTESPGFAELLDQLGSGLRPPAPEPARSGARVPAHPGSGGAEPPAPAPGPPVPPSPSPTARAAAPVREMPPVPLGGTGDLVVLVGLDDDALDTALAMSIAAGGADVRTAGELSAYGHLHLDGRQSATAARAHAVETEQTVLAAFGLGKGRHTLARLQAIAALSPDQLWVVVDAGRKHEDTARWVGLLRARLDVAAVAVVGAADTATPESVDDLGLPVGWIDGRPATRPLPWDAAPGHEG